MEDDEEEVLWRHGKKCCGDMVRKKMSMMSKETCVASTVGGNRKP